MSFVSSVFQQIDLIGENKFKDDKLDITVFNEPIVFLNELIKSLFPEDIMTEIYIQPSRIYQLKKTSYNSIDDCVSPDFLMTLKKSTLVYMKNLASGWEECTDEEKKFVDVAAISTTLVRRSKNFKEFLRLQKIKKNHNVKLTQTVTFDTPGDLNTCLSNVYVHGTKEDVDLFLNMLLEESETLNKNWGAEKRADNPFNG